MKLVSAAFGGVPLVGGTPFGGHDELPAREEFFANIHGLIQQATRIPAQVQNESLHSLRSQLFQRGLQIFAGLVAELHEANVANLVFAQRKILLAIDVFDHVHVDDRARQFVILHLPRRGAEHRDRHVRPRIAPENLDRIGQAHVLGALALDLDDPVAGKDARP